MNILFQGVFSMKTSKGKIFALILAAVVLATLLAGCEAGSSYIDRQATKEVGNILSENQPTPTDIDYSLERFNLIRRAYWVNGQHEKSRAVECPVERPLGYVVLMTESGAVVGRFVVDGKVSSLNSYLTPDSDFYTTGATTTAYWLPDVDGTYGNNDVGIFFFDPSGHYWEWDSHYLYSDVPMEIDNPIITYQAD